MNRPVSWWEIQVSDVEVAKKFYGQVFGWTFKAFDEAAGYEIAYAGDQMLGGLHYADGEPSGRNIQVVFDADLRDGVTLEDMLEAVEANGGTVVHARSALGGDMGWFAAVTDPSGLKLGLATMRPQA